MNGDVYRVRTWDHNTEDGTRFNYSLGRQKKKTVVNMMVLGEEPAEGPGIDLETSLNQLGWFRKPDSNTNARRS